MIFFKAPYIPGQSQLKNNVAPKIFYPRRKVCLFQIGSQRTVAYPHVTVAFT